MPAFHFDACVMEVKPAAKARGEKPADDTVGSDARQCIAAASC
jgi:hypothetical protein